MLMKAEAAQPDTDSLSILFADDETSLQELMRLELPQMGHRVTVCPDGHTAVAALQKQTFDCLLVDLDMPGMNGIEVIRRAHTISPATEAIVLTGKQSLETAIAALRFGVTDYLSKPCKLRELDDLLSRIAARRALRRQYVALQQSSSDRPSVQLVGGDASMAQVAHLIAKVAPTTSTVLIRGETGCGKELVARSIHEKSLRAKAAFVAINCGALPENLIESELFGHRRGAFTGADMDREGLFEAANGGTIFLDEIGELPQSMQAKLLRVLESGEVRRIGDNHTSKVDVRVVCATHRPLEDMVAAETFREDLLFRINTFEIAVPSLRERAADIPQLARHLYLRGFPQHETVEQIFAPETIEAFKTHSWPGNVRELANVIEHATILCDSLPIRPEHLPRHLGDRRLRKELKTAMTPMSLKEMESIAINEAVQRHGGNKPAAAEELGISLKTLYNKLNQAEAKKAS